MSVLNKKWVVKNQNSEGSLLQKLLQNRGLTTDEQMEQFFHPSAERDFHDPFLMKDMERAVNRIGQAIEKSERIMIFGDYDVDGITGTAILMRALRKLGANVSYRLPHRTEDGYGLREKFVREFSQLGVKVAITVDNGISCAAEVKLANELDIDTIITDHHTVPKKIPEAFAVLHPKLPGCGYPFSELTGAGVALKLAQALLTTRLKGPELIKEEIEKLLDLACMGTIGDLGALYGENRYIVKEGLKILENTRWPGLSRLKESAGVKGKIDTHDIGFLLGPRINAAGRMSHASHALKLLLHDADQSEALADNLEQLNRKRQKLTGELLEIAENLAAEQTESPLLVVHHVEFHGGIIGLLAAKLSEKYARPAIVMEERENNLVGSCRSVPGVNVVDILNGVADLLTHFGGHAAAAGFDIPKANLPAFKERTRAAAKMLIGLENCEPSLHLECELELQDISQKTVEMLEWFEPFGVGNQKPIFLCRNMPVKKTILMGKEKQHLKVTAQWNGSPLECVGFRLGKFAGLINTGGALDMACELEENEWNGKTTIQLVMRDFRVAK